MTTDRLAEAQRLHLSGDLAAAEGRYRDLLRTHPEHADARHLLGFVLYQAGRAAEARTELVRALAADSSRPDGHFTLGLVLRQLGDPAGAIAAFEQATRLDPSLYFAWTNLATLQEQAGQLAAAEASLIEATRRDASRPDAWYLLAALYLRLGRFDEARRCNDRGILSDPPEQHPRPVRLHALSGLDRHAEARALLEDWLQEKPAHPVALHLQAAYQGALPERCSPGFVTATFDRFAASFDDTLTRLHYTGPQLVREHLADPDLGASKLDVLDLGCGTGLIGVELAPYARDLQGVDLSAAMLAQAAARAVYTRLQQADLVDFLAGTDATFDLITCLDTCIYLGRLDTMFAGVARCLRDGGQFLFTTEKLEDPQAVPGYHLRLSGRYAHHPAYVSAALEDCGLQVVHCIDTTLRMESGYPIMAQYFRVRRDPPAGYPHLAE